MNIILYLLVKILLINCVSLDRSSKKDQNQIPILFETTDDNKVIPPVVKNKYASDSLKIYADVVVEFSYPVKDTINPMTIKSVRIKSLKIYEIQQSLLQEKAVYSENVLSENNKSDSQIMEDCINNIRFWYLHQPYEKIKGRKYYDTTLTFRLIYYITP